MGYNEANQTLEIEFVTGEVYEYLGVPVSVYQDLMKAGSKGSYFTDVVRGRYPFRQVA